MIGKKTIVIALVLVWAGVFFGSFLASSAIEGPRNIDTGFRRLDVLAQYHIVAISLSIVTAVLGIVWRRQAARILPIGLVPLSVTALLVVGVLVVATFLRDSPAPQPPLTPTAPAASAVDQPAT